jgi:SAM-dependent methyltransferase
LLTERLGAVAEQVIGLDISAVAVRLATEKLQQLGNVEVQQGDVAALGEEFHDRFDLVVLADTIYYLPPPIEDGTLKTLAHRCSKLLRPDGVLLLVNHYFPFPNAETKLTRRIHTAFQWSPGLKLVSQHYRAFFLASVLSAAAD